MRRFPAILLLLAVAIVASGAARYVHEMSHAQVGHAHVAHGHHHHGHDHDAPANGEEPTAPPAHVPHDESNCLIHALLKLPMLGAGFVPVLVCLGLFVAYLTLLPVPVRSRRPFLHLDCRGPPVG